VAWQTQNYLYRSSKVDRVVRAADIRTDDVVLDLGAGHGELTAHLAGRCRRVIAVELDPRLAARLRLRFAGAPNVSVREDDALATRLPREPYKVVANIPFGITARLIRRLTSAKYPPADAYLAVQREAAERVLGWPSETLFGMLTKPWFEASIMHRFRRTDFRPIPRVDVVFLRLRKRGPPLVSAAEADFYRNLVTFSFMAAKPTVEAALAPLVGHRRLRLLGLAPHATPSNVPVETWIALTRALSPSREIRCGLQLGSNVTTRRAMRRSAVLRIMRPARWPPSRRHA
jgi:23S rRNA (adenine-N6)-dimethyltransferase